MGAEIVPWVLTSGWASGINAYAVVLLMGLLGRFGHVSAVPEVLTRTDVLIAATVLFLLEVVADKVPYLDSAWDAVHTVVRPAVGATIGYLLAHDTASLDAAFAAATGGLTALASHGVKAGLRLAVNTSPEPASNIAVSSTEDLTVAAVICLAALHPWLAAGVAVTLLVAGAVLVVVVLRRVRRLRHRYAGWWRGRRPAPTAGAAAGEQAPRRE